jgi:hypothetical protein
MPVHRTPWGDFPPIIPQTSGSALKGDPAYTDAKQGDMRAARQLVGRLFKSEKFTPDTRIDFVAPVIQIDVGDRWNAIPLAYAERLARTIGAKVIPTIVQDNAVHHTDAAASQRLIAQPSFTGRVAKGSYIIVDDMATLGSTIANLRGHIEHNGGSVVAATTLATAIFSSKIVPDPLVIASIKRRFKSELTFLKGKLGFPPECLTGRESYFVNGLQNLESLRNPLAPSHRTISPAI